jgi:hypothetical protein
MREKAFYRRNKVRLLHDYEGKYIALDNNHVLDNDSDYSELVNRVFSKFGVKPTFIVKVLPKERIVRLKER